MTHPLSICGMLNHAEQQLRYRTDQMSETPRTDALMGKMLGATRKLDGPLSSASNLSTLVEFARRLERELAKAMKVVRETERVGTKVLQALPTEAVRSEARWTPVAKEIADMRINEVAGDLPIFAQDESGQWYRLDCAPRLGRAV